MNVGVDFRYLQVPHAYEIDVEFVATEQSVHVLKIHYKIGVSV